MFGICGKWPVTECRQFLLYYIDENYAVEDVMLLSSSEIPDTPPVNLRRVCSNWRILASLVATWDRRLSISRFWSVTACRSRSAVASALIPPVVSKITVTHKSPSSGEFSTKGQGRVRTRLVKVQKAQLWFIFIGLAAVLSILFSRLKIAPKNNPTKVDIW